jgi:hypothetical protein
MRLRKYAIRMVLLALPFCTGASATTPVSDSFDEQLGGVRAEGSTPATLSEPTTTVVEVTIPPATPATQSPSSDRALSANPLWAMPIKQFAVTRERPIFLPSRRPPAPPPSMVTVAKVIAPPKPKEPEQPQLSLVGTIASDEDSFGIFVDQATKAVIRLRIGEEFQGWTLQTVKSREVGFQKNQQDFVVALPQPGPGQPTVTVREEVAVDTRLVPIGGRQQRGGRP